MRSRIPTILPPMSLEEAIETTRIHSVAGVLEAFNLRGSGIEVEENVIWGPAYRATSAVQPPRAVRASVRLDF